MNAVQKKDAKVLPSTIDFIKAKKSSQSKNTAKIIPNILFSIVINL